MAGIFSDLFLTVTNSPDFLSEQLKTIVKRYREWYGMSLKNRRSSKTMELKHS